jgi:hypothetical protein
MKTILVLSVVAFFNLPSIAQAQFNGWYWEEPAFDLWDNASRATHILVVDGTGRVAEVWKGDASPGDRIPLERFRSSYLARLQFVNPAAPLPEMFDYDAHFNEWPPGCNRLIMFLIKSDRRDAASQFLDGWLPASRDGWFPSSIARVGLIGNVYVQRPPMRCFMSGIPDTGRRGMEDEFKQEVIRAMHGRRFCCGSGDHLLHR